MTRFEEFKVTGGQLLDQVKQLLHEGNVRSIAVKSKEGRVIVQFPLTLGVVGVALAPVLAAVGAVAALVTECTIVVERDESAPPRTIKVDPVDDADAKEDSVS
ncbi:DUF4342 domain-containing protein [Pseudoclavibacter sp. CFCC 13796]|uniref:DUF4342 domain-containing protein n=1 Tax=Pseudoclavibacter sp. CFCC 13796 TaxID=2615179 RepID=UPI001301496A|nr:DUF4342 domain-containing protein [Pseudoclavibacter sp. CFCC 13796]KAB1659913.1 DUF4342 domain-containing protein [Pseudoclavibacter sp. CFCC 13796]